MDLLLEDKEIIAFLTIYLQGTTEHAWGKAWKNYCFIENVPRFLVRYISHIEVETQFYIMLLCRWYQW